MIKKTIFALVSAAAAVAVTSGCGTSGISGPANVSQTSDVSITAGKTDSQEIEMNDGECTVTIGSEVFINGDGASYQSGVLSITKGGVYNISGSIPDGSIYVDTEENVKLILNGISVNSSSGAALYCYNAKNLYIELADGKENSLSDASGYTFGGKNESSENNEPNAAVYSKSDLIFSGSGKLNVTGNYALGIRCNDDLTIEGGDITVSAVTNGVRGSDSVTVSGGSLTVAAEKDGIKSTNDTDSGKGFVAVSGGIINVTAGEDGIQSQQQLSVSGGEINITTTGDVVESTNDGWGAPWRSDISSNEDEATSKGLKSGAAMTISGGKIKVNSTDHSIHGAGAILIENGELSLSSSKGKGITAHGSLTVDGGIINVANSTEGLESKADITINGGEITINAADDGLNSGGGNDRFNFSYGQNETNDASSDTHNIYINDGYVYISAKGDGIDSNGNIEMNGGTVLVNGPQDGGNGALDCGDRGNSITVNGGFLIAAGSRQMAEVPDSGSKQNSFGIVASLNAGDTFALKNSSGKNIAVFTVEKQVQHIVISSLDIKIGETYNLYTGVTADGDNKNGLYSNDSNVTADTNPAVTITSDNTVTVNQSAGGFGGGFNHRDDNGQLPNGEKPNGEPPISNQQSA